MKQLLSYFKPYLKESFLAPLFKLLEAVFELLVPMVIAGIVDQSIPQKDQGHLWMQMGLLFVFCGYRRFGSLSCSVLLSQGSSRIY